MGIMGLFLTMGNAGFYIINRTISVLRGLGSRVRGGVVIRAWAVEIDGKGRQREKE